MPKITIIHADGRFKVLKDGEQIMVLVNLTGREYRFFTGENDFSAAR